METRPSDLPATLLPTPPRIAELDRLGDEIAELSAHLEAATARLLALIREFDARGGWNTGFRSCAAWLSWRVGLDLGAARERVRVARALGALPTLAEALARGAFVRQGPRSDPRGDPRDRSPAPRGGACWHGAARRAHRAGWRRGDRHAGVRHAAPQHPRRAPPAYRGGHGPGVRPGRPAP